jgi:hypothetical protein
MASVLLSYIDGDVPVAQALRKLFEGAGHSVSGTDRAFRSRGRYDAVVVVWSDAALTSPYVYENARIALKRRKLVQVYRGSFDTSKLPAVFRSQNLIPTTDSEQILHGLRDLNGKETPPLIPTAWKAVFEKEAGQLVHRVPKKMCVGVTEVVEVQLGRARRDIVVDIKGNDDMTNEDVPIVETLNVDLHGSPGAFDITRQSRQTQLVKGSLIWNTAFDQQRFGRWLWNVTPKKRGTHELVVKVSADLSDSRGVTTSQPYSDRMFSIAVRANQGNTAVRMLMWAATGAAACLVGTYAHETWWPKVKVWLMGAGLLS